MKKIEMIDASTGSGLQTYINFFSKTIRMQTLSILNTK